MWQRIKEDVHTICTKDPAAHSKFEVVLCYPGLHAIWLHRISHYLWQQGLVTVARLIATFARWITGIEIHPGANIGRRVFIDHGHGVVIGETTQIGDDCTLYQGVTLGGVRLNKGQKRHPTLRQGVIVGAGAKILGAFEVGEFAKIGSNAVVLHPVPAHASAVGNPARVISHNTEQEEKFTAYGVDLKETDPLAKMLELMCKEMTATNQLYTALAEKLKEMNIVIDDTTLTEPLQLTKQCQKILDQISKN